MPPLLMSRIKSFPVKLALSFTGAAAVCWLGRLFADDRSSTIALACATVATAYAPFYLDGSEYSEGTRYWRSVAAFLSRKILSSYQSMGFKPMVIVKDPDAFKSNNQVIFCSHPHGVMSFHHALFYMHIDGADPLIWAVPLQCRRALGARSLFKIPIVRDLVLLAGAVDASAAVASKCLSSGLSLTILPGGEHEQLLAEYDKHVIYVKARKGFCKLAVKHNVPIVPSYCFGETSTFYTSSFLINPRKWLAKKFFVAIPLAWGGSWWNPFAPLAAPLTHCVGAPLPVPPADESLDKLIDFRRRVDILHAQYVAAISTLFEENKGSCGYPNAELVIL